MYIKAIITAVSAALFLQVGASFAQEGGADRPRGERGGDREGRGGNPEEFRQRMNDRLKTSLKATDEEWAVIQPLVEKVTTKQRESGGNRWGGRGGRDRGGDNDNRPQSATATASQALRTVLESESASPDEIKAKLTAMREARKASEAELAKVREELRQVLSVRQEAAMVSMGILE